MSWYGDKPVSVDLGGAFHSRRLRLVSSQVGQVAASRRPRWDYRRRVEAAVRLLAVPALDALVAEEIAFEDAPRELPRILGAGAAGPRPRHPLPASLIEQESPHVCRRGARPDHDRPQPARSVLRPGAEHARRHVRRRRRLLPRDAHQAERGGGHRRGARRAQQDAQAAVLSEPRCPAAVQGHADHHRVPVPLRIRRHGQGRQGAARWARTARSSPRSASRCTRRTWRAPPSRGRCEACPHRQPRTPTLSSRCLSPGCQRAA